MVKARISGIDGLKGIAILAVVFTHIPLDIWYKFIPQFLQWILAPVLKSGGVGVTIFFLTTGFLMGFLYSKPVSVLDFYSRRYKRLFPAFLVMVVSFTIFKIFPIPNYSKILVVIGFGIVANRIIKFIFINKSCLWFGKKPIFWILLFQLSVAIWYIFYLQKIPASVFYINWPLLLQTLITFLVNATLILPFGKYIGQLDGIYWALCAEVGFYLLYPPVIAPIIHSVNNKPLFLIILLFLSLLPFSYGLLLISQMLLGFRLLNLHLIIYFLVGAYIGINNATIKQKVKQVIPFLNNQIFTLILLLIFFSSVILEAYISQYFQIWLSIVMVVPAGLLLTLVVSVSDKEKSWIKSPVLIFLGKYSYAIFLTHSLVIQVVKNYITTTNALNSIEFVILTISGSIILAVILHELTERPYFAYRKKTVNDSKIVTYNPKTFKFSKVYLIVGLIFLNYLAFKPAAAFFTKVIRHGRLPIWSVLQNREIVLSDKPYRQSFVAYDDNLGLIETHIKKEHIPEVSGGFVPFLLNMRLMNDQDQVVSQSTFQAYQILDDWYHPFGFPLEKNSAGKKYTVEYQLSENSPSEQIILVTNESSILSVYFMDKKVLLKNPKELLSFIFFKFKEPLDNPMYWMVLLHLAPILILLNLSIKSFNLDKDRR